MVKKQTNISFIIILLIVIGFVIYNFNKSLLTSIEKKRGLIIFMGESFRTGSQGTRTRGNKESYDEQIKGCKTHIKFIEHLKTKVNVDVCLETYSTQFNNDLIELYKPYLIQSNFHTDPPMGLTNLFKNALKSINTDKYDFIFYIRIDLYLKDYFIELFNPYSDKILFPFVCWYQWSTTKKGHPRIADTMIFIPSKYFKYFKDIEIIYHTTWDVLIEQGLTYDDIDVMINTYHDSDPMKDNNPLYYIVNRPEVKTWDSPGKIFNKYNLPDPLTQKNEYPGD